MGLLIFAIIMFIGLVVVHEFGHFIMARRNGVEVEEFGIGFPPAVWKKRVKSPKGDYDFTINALPLGGFVKLKGENDSNAEKGSFGAASLTAKVKIMVAGVAMNLLTAFIILTFVALAGMPMLIDDQFTVASDTKNTKNELILIDVPKGSWLQDNDLKKGLVIKSINGQDVEVPEQLEEKIISANGNPVSITFIDSKETISKDITVPSGVTVYGVDDDSPANGAGLSKEDTLYSVAGIELYSSSQLRVITEKNEGSEVEIVYSKDGSNEKLSKKVTLNTKSLVEQRKSENKNIGYFGAAVSSPPVANYKVSRSTWSAPIVAAGLIKQFTTLTFQGLGSAIASLFQGEGSKASEQVAGPVGIFVILRDGTILGYQFILLIIAVISLTLAIMNVLPIPALDGGRLFVTLLFRALRKPLDEDLENMIHGFGFMALMILFVVITVVDVRRFF